MPDPLDVLLRETLQRQAQAAPAAGDLLAGARARHRRHRASVAAVAAAFGVVAAVAVPVALLSGRPGAAPTPASTVPASGAPTPSPGAGKPGPLATVTGRWQTAGVGPMAATGGYGFGIETGAAQSGPAPVVRFGADGVHRLRLGSTAYDGPALIAASTTAVYVATQVPHRLVQARDQVWRIDPTSFTVTASVALADPTVALAATDSALYVATPTGVVALDPVTLATRARYDVPGAQPPPAGSSMVFGLATDGTDVYLAYGDVHGGRLLDLTSSLVPVGGAATLPPGQGAALVAGPCGPWLLTPQHTVRRVAARGQLGVEVALPGGAESSVTGGAVTCSGVAVTLHTGGNAVLGYAGRSVTQPLDPGTGDSLAVSLKGPTLWTGGTLVERLVPRRNLPPAAVTVPAAPCTAGALRARWVSGGMGGGNDISAILVWNVSAKPCRLAGAASFAAYLASGAPDPRAGVINAPRVASAVLPPNTRAPVDGTARGPGEYLVATLFGGERDDPSQPNGLCRAQDEVAPARLRLTLGALSFTVTNHDPGGDFHAAYGCHGAVTLVSVALS